MSARPIFTLLLASLALVCSASGVGATAVADAPENGYALQPDPRVRLGVLDNGFRYAVRPHPLPPGRVSFVLFVDAGSRHEAEGELGYAHFVEHLAFAGSRDFPGDSAIRTLQRFGLGFGSEFNAATARSYTVYEVRNVPAADPAAVAAALRVLRNFADGLTFLAEAVERERGVILSERNVRAGRVAYWWGREFEFLAPYLDEIEDREMETLFEGTPLGRSQLGTSRSLKRATPDSLRAFHDRWYRPGRMVLAVAGGVDPAEMAARIEAEFGAMAARGPEPTEAPVLAPRTAAKPRVSVFTDPESPAAIVTLLAAAPRLPTDDEERRCAELTGSIALQMLNRRLGATLRVSAQIEGWVGREAPGWCIPLVRVRTSPPQWPTVAIALETELRRAVQHGFTSDELATAIAARARKARWNELDAESRPATEVAVALAHALGDRVLFASAEAERRWTEAALVRLTPEDCRAALERLWPAASTRLVVAGPVPDDEKARTVRRAVQEARTRNHDPYRAVEEPLAQLAQRPGPPGRVIASEHNAELDCWFVQFDNGVRLNVKSTHSEPGKIRVRVGFGYGLLGTEPGREGLAFGIAALNYGGSERLTADQERELLEHGEIATSFGFGADRFGLAANCPSPGLRTALGLFAARIEAPGFRSGSEVYARAFIDKELARSDRTAAVLAEDRMREHMFGGHHALTRPRRADTEHLNFEDLRHWLEPQLKDSPIEIAVVGDIGPEEAIAAVADTFGKLPLRATIDPMADRRMFTPGATPERLEVRFAGRRTVASVALAWRLPDVVGQRDDCHMRLLASLVEDRLRVRLRQQMGKTYTPVVGVLSERALTPAMLYLRCRVETAPRHLERVAEAARQAIAELVRDGISDEELERARLPLIRAAEDSATSNVWWLGVLGEAQTKPQYIEEQGNQRQIFQMATREDLQALARLLFAPDRLCELRVVPEERRAGATGGRPPGHEPIPWPAAGTD